MKENLSARLAASARQRRDYPETVFSCAGKMPFLPILSSVPARQELSFPCPFSVSLPSAWTQTAAAYLSRSRPPGEGRQSPAFLTRRLLSTCLGMDCAAVQNQSRPPGEGRQSPRVSNEKIIKRPPRHELRSFAKPVMPARRGPCLCRASCGDGSRQ